MTQYDFIEFKNEVEVSKSALTILPFNQTFNYITNDLISKVFNKELYHEIVDFNSVHYLTSNDTFIVKVSFKAIPKTEDELYCDCLEYLISTINE